MQEASPSGGALYSPLVFPAATNSPGGASLMNEPGMHKGDEFAGKVALVTGAARNIGRAIALTLASGGAKVAVNTRSNVEQARGVVGEIKALGTDAEAV